MSLDYGIVEVRSYDVSAQGILVGNLDHGSLHVSGHDIDDVLKAETDHGTVHLSGYDAVAVHAELGITLLKSEFCRFENNFKDLRVRIKIVNQFDPQQDNIFTAKIITGINDPADPDSKLEYSLDTWTERISENTTKLIKEYDLNLIEFWLDNCDVPLPLNIGKHTLQVQINDHIATSEFDLVMITVQSIKDQYMLGVPMEAQTELAFQQDLRKITGVEVLEISRETPVGSKELVWDASNKTLQWDEGEPVEISENFIEYHLLNYMGSSPGIVDGDYIRISIEDPDTLPLESQTELVIVDIKQYKNSDYRYWIDNAYRVVAETMIMTDLEPTLYSSDRSLGYKYLQPVLELPKNYSETSNYSFEFAVNKLQCVIELWAQYFGSESKISINNNVLTWSEDSQVVIRGYPYGSIGLGALGGSSSATIGFAGRWDKTIYAKNHDGSRNKVKNFWHGTILSGILEDDLRSLALDVARKVAAVDLYVQSGLGRSAGIASRSFSVGGISSSYNTVESAENNLMSSSILQLQRDLGTGRATKDEQKTGMVNRLRNKITGGSMAFKY